MQGHFVASIIAVLAVSLMAGCSCPIEDKEAKNKEVIVWIYGEGVNKQNPDAWDEVLTDDYVRHCQAMPSELQEMRGIDKMKGFLSEHFVAFPDWNENVTLLIGEGDYVSYVSIGAGTHLGPMGKIPATGKAVADIKTFVVHRFVDGKIAESWVIWDNVEFLRQLGLFPPQVPNEGDTQEATGN